jgi:hypothetical protein
VTKTIKSLQKAVQRAVPAVFVIGGLTLFPGAMHAQSQSVRLWADHLHRTNCSPIDVHNYDQSRTILVTVHADKVGIGPKGPYHLAFDQTVAVRPGTDVTVG